MELSKERPGAGKPVQRLFSKMTREVTPGKVAWLCSRNTPERDYQNVWSRFIWMRVREESEMTLACLIPETQFTRIEMQVRAALAGGQHVGFEHAMYASGDCRTSRWSVQMVGNMCLELGRAIWAKTQIWEALSL